MKLEIETVCSLLKLITERSPKITEEKAEVFQEQLKDILTTRFKGHWYPSEPQRGTGYRCVRVNSQEQYDPVILEACKNSNINYKDLKLPVDFTIWVDPFEVNCRVGEQRSQYFIASRVQADGKSYKENRVPTINIDDIERRQIETSRRFRDEHRTSQGANGYNTQHVHYNSGGSNSNGDSSFASYSGDGSANMQFSQSNGIGHGMHHASSHSSFQQHQQQQQQQQQQHHHNMNGGMQFNNGMFRGHHNSGYGGSSGGFATSTAHHMGAHAANGYIDAEMDMMMNGYGDYGASYSSFNRDQKSMPNRSNSGGHPSNVVGAGGTAGASMRYKSSQSNQSWMAQSHEAYNGYQNATTVSSSPEMQAQTSYRHSMSSGNLRTMHTNGYASFPTSQQNSNLYSISANHERHPSQSPPDMQLLQNSTYNQQRSNVIGAPTGHHSPPPLTSSSTQAFPKFNSTTQVTAIGPRANASFSHPAQQQQQQIYAANQQMQFYSRAHNSSLDDLHHH